MAIKCVKIGEMDYGIDGKDVYYQVSKPDQDMTIDEAKDYLLSRVAGDLEPSRIGGIFVSSVSATKMAHYNWECIGVVRWLYDV